MELDKGHALPSVRASDPDKREIVPKRRVFSVRAVLVRRLTYLCVEKRVEILKPGLHQSSKCYQTNRILATKGQQFNIKLGTRKSRARAFYRPSPEQVLNQLRDAGFVLVSVVRLFLEALNG